MSLPFIRKDFFVFLYYLLISICLLFQCLLTPMCCISVDVFVCSPCLFTMIFIDSYAAMHDPMYPMPMPTSDVLPIPVSNVFVYSYAYYSYAYLHQWFFLSVSMPVYSNVFIYSQQSRNILLIKNSHYMQKKIDILDCE